MHSSSPFHLTSDLVRRAVMVRRVILVMVLMIWMMNMRKTLFVSPGNCCVVSRGLRCCGKKVIFRDLSVFQSNLKFS